MKLFLFKDVGLLLSYLTPASLKTKLCQGSYMLCGTTELYLTNLT